MGSFLSIPILVLAAAMQATLAPQIQLLGGRPDLVLLLVLSWAVNAGLDESIIWAFVGGIAQDLLSASPTGTSTLGMIPVVFIIGSLTRQLYNIGFVMLIGLVIAGTIFKTLIEIVVLLLAGYQVGLVEIGYVLFPTILYNLVFIWPIYWFVRRVQRRLYTT
jgi:rod shape-determining protein MreD